MDRYHRQTLLPFIGAAGQGRLGESRVLLIGCGALGTVIADQLVRAGVGHLRIVDRDVVEQTNLQRQVLFDEADAKGGIPKAVAAANRLGAINSEIKIEPVILDVHSGNIEELVGDNQFDLLLDGSDNVEIRYLINDVSVKRNIPWIYGACVGVEGRVMPIRPGVGPCLRCVFPNPPGAGELATCDTAGVLSPAAAMVASMQVIGVMQMLTGGNPKGLKTFDAWAGRFRTVDTGERRADCECCGKLRFDFLNQPVEQSAVRLCGRNAVQIHTRSNGQIKLIDLAQRLESLGKVQRTPFLVRCRLADSDLMLTVFADGRTIVQGTQDISEARSLVSKFVGS